MIAPALGVPPLIGTGAEADPSPRFEVVGDYFVDHEARLGYRSYSQDGATKSLARILSGRDELHHYTGSTVRYYRALDERPSP